MNYNLNFPTLIKRLVPTFLRREKQLAWLGALIKPVVQHHREFLNYREKLLEEIRYNGQVAQIEHLLNLTFDPQYKTAYTNRNEPFKIGKNKIYIKDNLSNAAGHEFFMYRESEAIGATLHTQAENASFVTLFTRDEFIVEGVQDFTVFYPQELVDETRLDRLHALVKKYTLAGIQFNALPF